MALIACLPAGSRLPHRPADAGDAGAPARHARWGNQQGRRAAVVLAGVGIFGASLFFGDSMITPAISVLSAVEASRSVEPPLGSLVVR